MTPGFTAIAMNGETVMTDEDWARLFVANDERIRRLDREFRECFEAEDEQREVQVRN